SRGARAGSRSCPQFGPRSRPTRNRYGSSDQPRRTAIRGKEPAHRRRIAVREDRVQRATRRLAPAHLLEPRHPPRWRQPEGPRPTFTIRRPQFEQRRVTVHIQRTETTLDELSEQVVLRR